MNQTLIYFKEARERDEEMLKQNKSLTNSITGSKHIHSTSQPKGEMILIQKRLDSRKKLGQRIIRRLRLIFAINLIAALGLIASNLVGEFVLRQYLTGFYKILVSFAMMTQFVTIQLAPVAFAGVKQFKQDGKLYKTFKAVANTFATTSAAHGLLEDHPVDHELEYGGLEIEEFDDVYSEAAEVTK